MWTGAAICRLGLLSEPCPDSERPQGSEKARPGGTAQGSSSLPSVHCLLTAGLEESSGWKVSITS